MMGRASGRALRAALFFTAAIGQQALGAQTAPSVTFSHDIAPLVFKHCAGCHRPGGGAPFDLLTFDDVRRRASQIALVTKSRYMPPWKPAPGSGDFADARRLSDEEIDRIQRWVGQGAPLGDQAVAPAAPVWASEWQLGKPDLVVGMPAPYTLSGGGPDVFRSFVIPVSFAAGRYVEGFEFRTSRPQVVHHANVKVDRTGSSRRLDQREAEPGFDGGAGRDARFPEGQFLGWTPGQSARRFEASAWRLEPHSDFVVELHMVPTGKPEPVDVSIALYFTNEAPSRVPYMLRLGSQSIDIPAGERAYRVTDSYVLPVDVEVLAVQPHAHLLARRIEAFAQLPDGATKPIIRIDDWDFRWQDVYRYMQPLPLPSGSTLVMQYSYDNSADNARNPNRPPRRVTFGQTTASEMGDLWLQVLPPSDAARTALDKDYAPKMLREDIAGDEKILEVNPNDARTRADLALCYLEAGRKADAIAELEQAVRLEPAFAAAHYDLGTILLNDGKLSEARQHFERAVSIKPDFSEAHNNLGAALFLEGSVDEAIDRYRDALRLNPRNAEARFNLARALARRGDADDALVQYREALDIRPDDPDSHTGLASLLTTRGRIAEAVTHYRTALRLDPDRVDALTDLAWLLASDSRAGAGGATEAVSLAERAAALTNRRNATVLDALALAYFSTGNIRGAIEAARMALGLASAGGPAELRDRIRERLEYYERQVAR